MTLNNKSKDNIIKETVKLIQKKVMRVQVYKKLLKNLKLLKAVCIIISLQGKTL